MCKFEKGIVLCGSYQKIIKIAKLEKLSEHFLWKYTILNNEKKKQYKHFEIIGAF